MTKISSSPTFCPDPWTTLNIDQRGHVLPCLHSMGWSQGRENSMGNIKQTSIQSVIDGAALTQIKHTIAAGEWHDFCRTCQRDEASSGLSARTYRLNTLEPATRDLIDADITAFQLTNLTVNWTNLCNLTCTYCNPATSTAWQQVLKMPISHVRNESAGLIELAKANRTTLKGLTLGGGEPLLQRGLLEFLQEIDSEQVNVLITTNLTVDLDTNAVYQLLRTWPHVTWQISFDNATADRFEYVRRGATWSDFVANIQHMQADLQQVVAHPAYSVYCALDLVAYYEFCTQHALPIYWCDLTDPPALDARRLPEYLRLQAQAEIDQIQRMYSNNSSLSLDILQRYRQQLSSDYPMEPRVRPVPTPAAWHAQQEQQRRPTKTFAELWPEYAE